MKKDLKDRLKKYALRIIRLYSSLPKRDEVAQVLGRQVLRSGTSPGAQYREALRSRSKAEFISKMNSALQELDETEYWLELLIEGEKVNAKKLEPLLKETDELMSIFVSAIRTAKGRGEK